MLLGSLAILSLTGLILWRTKPETTRLSAWFGAAVPLAILGWIWRRTDMADDPYHEHWAWLPSLNLDLTFGLDGLSLLFTVIILGIGAAVVLYTHYYLEGDPRQGAFYLFLFLFMASMLGIVWSDNVLAFFVFWEGTTVTSYLLIGHGFSATASQRGARNALIVTGGGGFAMLAGFLLLGQATGDWTFSAWNATPPTRVDDTTTVALVLILLGAFTKSGQFPFHFWLPGAMAAPTPASAYLHSATMVKAGIFLAARIHPAFGDHPAWLPALVGFGAVTCAVSGVLALTKTDLKGMLAYATLAQLGLLFVALGQSGKAALVAAVVGILAHALYKGPLFLSAGMIEHATGTRDIRRLAGQARPLWTVSIIVVASALSLAALPVWGGFLSKEYLLDSLLHLADSAWIAWLGLIGALIGSTTFVWLAIAFVHRIFLRREPDTAVDRTHQLHPPAVTMVAGPMALAVIGFTLPLTLDRLFQPLVQGAVSAVAGEMQSVHIHLWSGFNAVFLLSLAALAAGTGLYLLGDRALRVLHRGVDRVPSGDLLLDRTLGLAARGASWISHGLQDLSLTSHVSIVLGSAVLVVVLVANRLGSLFNPSDLRLVAESPVALWLEGTILLLSLMAALTVLASNNRLAPIIALSVVGLNVTLFFVLFAAPDLALTQLLVEVLVFVLIILILYKLPAAQPPRLPPGHKIRNIGIACITGAFGFVLVLLASGRPRFEPISNEMIRATWLDAHGAANVVNVILTDFRGFDTFGEMTVIAIAGIGVYSLVRAYRFRPRRSRASE
ncbi:MAG: DUF4040 domain-containing protein [Caldilineaceae bacterium SB0664_bin_22]|nr:DUF4040 domain-containing protein [Caldilineaceae bacterium SB0664_bin_22]MYC62058.1 DUF4040 domain-containing protein [Caldilineaceae bacterium SB0661_bin_34]